MEETALAVEALSAPGLSRDPGLSACPIAQSVRQRRLMADSLRSRRSGIEQYAPIGFYFAKLWYYEELYPLSFTLAALGRLKSIVEAATPPGRQGPDALPD